MADIIIYDGDCGLCTRVADAINALDWFGTMRWMPLQSPEAARYGIPRERLEQSVYLVSGNSHSHGFAAVQRILLRVPLTYAVAAYAIAKKPWSALLFAFLFSPLSAPIGEPAYEWVSRNRYRISGSTCDNRSK
jgi:predicted DCC family thiol-disulfide oxidoreductase YuxK